MGLLVLLDDAARLRAAPNEDLVLTKDTLAAGIHFFADDPAKTIAQKALRVNLSDLAAKGATPKAYLLSLALPADWSNEWIRDFASGLAEDQATYNVELYGGDTLKSPHGLVVSITAIGSLPQNAMVTRLGGRSGDALYVTGTIGDAALGFECARNGFACGRLAVDRCGNKSAALAIFASRTTKQYSLLRCVHMPMGRWTFRMVCLEI